MLRYLTTPRGPSARAQLAIAWEHPVDVAAAASAADAGAEAGRSRSVQARRALEPDQAFARLAGEDRRPLLVLRECLTCTGTDDALLTREADNEKTMLLSRWFHCVKLPPDVLEEDHPFHRLFEGDDPGHLFVSRWNGDERVDLRGDQSRTELWDLMNTRLAADYGKVPKKPLKQLFRRPGRPRRRGRQAEAARAGPGPRHREGRSEVPEAEEDPARAGATRQGAREGASRGCEARPSSS